MGTANETWVKGDVALNIFDGTTRAMVDWHSLRLMNNEEHGRTLRSCYINVTDPTAALKAAQEAHDRARLAEQSACRDLSRDMPDTERTMALPSAEDAVTAAMATRREAAWRLDAVTAYVARAGEGAA